MDLLAIDTFSDVCSVAFFSTVDSRPALVRSTSETRSHASKLAVFAAELIKEAGKSPNGVVVIAGPGSYTGLRIGVSTAKGLAWSLDIPLYAVSALQYLANIASQPEEESVVVTIIKARIDEVFLARFRQTTSGLLRESEDVAMSVDQATTLLSEMQPAKTLVSNHAETLKPFQNLEIATEIVEPRIEGIKTLLSNHLNHFRVNDLNSFEPAYLKEFVARKAAKSIFDRLPF
jgi:tRNA threonylcarbamoyladenosine biosynthesis protein TsaB